METQNSNPQSEVRKMKPIVKILIVFVIIAVVVAATVIFISVFIQKEKIAGTYYEVKKLGGAYYFVGPQEKMELTKDGQYIESGLVGEYTYSNGKIVITAQVLGMTMRIQGPLENGVLTLTQSSLIGEGETTYIYVKLDTPPEKDQPCDQIPSEK